MMTGVPINIQQCWTVLVHPGLEAGLAAPLHSTRIHQHTHKVFQRDVIFLKELAEHLFQRSSIHLHDLQGPQMLHHHLPQVRMLVANEHGEDLQNQKVYLPCNVLQGTH